MTLPFSLRELCPNLRELILPRVRVLPKELQSNLPESNIEHLWLETTLDDDSAELNEMAIETIDWAKSLPNLRLVILEKCNEESSAEMWKKRSGGRVRVRTNRLSLAYIYEDLIWTSELPRSRTIENLQHMVVGPNSA
ncbi:hypothetical protein FRC03_002345 [Tulasnella sp. 419]|nr:hypothetical protein FRC03_002345 [Tulasnella sp. 419]